MRGFFFTSLMWAGLVCALGVAACSNNESVPSRESATEIAKDMGQQFSSAVVRASSSSWAAKDVEQLVNLYTDDAILFPPKGEPIKGRDAIRAYWTRSADRQILEHSIQTERADLAGDLLVEHGKFVLVWQSGQNVPERGSSNFISTWKRGTDGSWRKYLDSWW